MSISATSVLSNTNKYPRRANYRASEQSEGKRGFDQMEADKANNVKERDQNHTSPIGMA
jgi:hypothetical protein